MPSILTFNAIQVSQKLMVQGYSGHAKYSGGLDVARKVLRSEGIRGLYRGFGLSVMTYVPSSAVWWASYGSSQRYIWRWEMLKVVLNIELLKYCFFSFLVNNWSIVLNLNSGSRNAVVHNINIKLLLCRKYLFFYWFDIHHQRKKYLCRPTNWTLGYTPLKVELYPVGYYAMSSLKLMLLH